MNFDNTNFMYNTEKNFLDMIKKKRRLILFGAGDEMVKTMERILNPHNILVDYMVDNDFRKWYSKYMGIEIREPECLRDETDEAVILITSLYPYRIEKQLKRLGVTNYFSSLLFIEEHIGKEQFMIFF